MNFKLLAIRPLEGCVESVRNILEPDTTYYFDDAYIYDTDKEYLIRKKDFNELPDDFFYKKENQDSSLSYVNIQAIVGKNGSGKSSIIELLLRILNNFFKQYRLSEVTDNLIYSKGVKAELFYLRDNNIFKIYVDSTNLNDFKLTKDDLFEEPQIDVRFYDTLDTDYEALQIHLKEKSGIREKNFIELQNLFFSMYINYSLYGMDSNDFIDETVVTNFRLKEDKIDVEEISWIDSIFHKNDGYQTPVVIHPYREEAQINIRNEKYLLRQRLVSLIFTEQKYINLTDKIIFKKLKVKSVKQDILSNKIDEILGVSYRKYKVNPYDNNIFYIINNLFDSEMQREYNQKVKIEFIYKMYHKINSRYHILEKNNDNLNNDYELYSQFLLYIIPYEDIEGKDFKDQNYRNQVEIEIRNSSELHLQKKLDFLFQFFSKLSYRSLIEILVLDIYYDFWLKEIKIEEPIYDKFEKALFEYLVVKSNKILRYPKYSNFGDVDGLSNFILNDFQLNENVKIDDRDKGHETFLNKLKNDLSHISIKIQQVRTILKAKKDNSKLYNIYRDLYISYIKFNEDKVLEINELSKVISESRSAEIQPIYLIPPPLFDLDIEISNGKTDQVQSIKKISSGEFQFLTMISSIVYHLKNIDSVEEAKYNGPTHIEYMFQYKNVSIVLDEIELYFHPEFQRKFIYEIINRLKDLSFKNIQAISILFITHSPFILSDIPSQNILRIKDGTLESTDRINSFAANIYDLLKDEFFLNNGAIGAYASDKIASILKKDIVEQEDIDIINLIGDPFLKGVIKKEIENKTSIDVLEDEIRRLQIELQQKKSRNATN